jgi:hypothetical protein
MSSEQKTSLSKTEFANELNKRLCEVAFNLVKENFFPLMDRVQIMNTIASIHTLDLTEFKEYQDLKKEIFKDV